MRKDHAGIDTVSEVVNECLMTRARRISRVLTNIYDLELRGFGLNASQFSMLILIARLGGASRSEIGRANFQDRSTLTRALAPLLKDGLIEEVTAGAGRSRPIYISNAGKALLEKAAPSWRHAQLKAQKILGSNNTNAMIAIAEDLPRDGTFVRGTTSPRGFRI